jgi:hypothetical protein
MCDIINIGIGFCNKTKNNKSRIFFKQIKKNSTLNINIYPSKTNNKKIDNNKILSFENNVQNKIYSLETDKTIESNDMYHSNFDLNFMNFCINKQKKGKYWIHTFYNYYDETNSKDLDKINNFKTEIKLAKDADIKIAISPILCKKINTYGIDCIYLPKIINFDKLEQANQKKFYHKYNLKNFFLFIGDTSYNKNCIDFIEAANKCPEIYFLFMCKGITKEKIINKTKIIPKDNISIMSKFKNKDIINAISSCVALIITSYEEIFPKILFKAMALSVPCIIPEEPEWSKIFVKDNMTYKYKINNIDNLIKNILYCIKTTHVNLDIMAAKKHVFDNFSAKNVTLKLDKIYKTLANKKKILFSSTNNKFIEELINLYSKEYYVKIDFFNETNFNEKKELLNWADIIFCEWCAQNALWYSLNKKENQDLFIRIHRYEIFTNIFEKIKWKNVKNLIFISPEIKNISNKFLLQEKFINKNNFDFNFYYKENNDLFKYEKNILINENYLWNHYLKKKKEFWNKFNVKLLEEHDYNKINDEFTNFNGGIVIYNYVKSQMFNNVPKIKGSEYNIGMMGFTPKLKRPDIALDIIEYLLKINTNYKLYFIGNDYKDVKWILKDSAEMNFYKTFYDKIEKSEFKNNIIFESYSSHPELWFTKIGYILSISDIEGSHQSIAEGMATGSIPFIFGDALKKYKLDNIYPHKYCFYEDNITELCNSILKYTENEELRINESNYCKKFSYDNFNITKIKKIYDEVIFKFKTHNL